MRSSDQRRDFLLSIRPQYARHIVEGRKTVELRRKFTAKAQPGSIALIYCTSPIKAIIGAAYVTSVEQLAVKQIWSKHKCNAMIEKTAFDAYFHGAETGFAILLSGARRFDEAIPATQLRKRFGFVAPQSYIYLDEKYSKLLKDEKLQIPY